MIERVEHNIRSVLDIADRAYVLQAGQVVVEGQPRKLLESDILERVFLGKLAAHYQSK